MADERFTIVLVPGRDRYRREPVYRLRLALKRLRRDYALKCERIESSNKESTNGISRQSLR